VFDSPLVEHFEVLAYDQRGLGRSAKPDIPYTMADYADDAAALMEHLGWQRAHVVGVSFGGMVAQELALRHPDRLDRLVLCCTSSGGAGGSSFPLHTLRDMDPEKRVRLRLAIGDVRHDGAWQQSNPETFERMVAEKLGDLALSADDPDSACGSWRQLEARAAHDAWIRLPELRLPVLVCGGRYDGQAEPHVVEALAAAFRGRRSSSSTAGTRSCSRCRWRIDESSRSWRVCRLARARGRPARPDERSRLRARSCATVPVRASSPATPQKQRLTSVAKRKSEPLSLNSLSFKRSGRWRGMRESQAPKAQFSGRADRAMPWSWAIKAARHEARVLARSRARVNATVSSMRSSPVHRAVRTTGNRSGKAGMPRRSPHPCKTRPPAQYPRCAGNLPRPIGYGTPLVGSPRLISESVEPSRESIG
jgi:3-oxoadipate enol-lactonase